MTKPMQTLKTFFIEDRETKNTVKFNEEPEEAPLIGALYIQKHALRRLGYKKGDFIQVTIEIKGGN